MKKKLDNIFLLVKIFSCESRFPRRTFVRRKTMSNSFSCHFAIFQKKKKRYKYLEFEPLIEQKCLVVFLNYVS